MTDQLDMARFRALSEAYGGAVVRWPEQHRAAARHLSATAEGAAILERAAALDIELDAWRVQAPSAAIAALIAAHPPTAARRVGGRLRWWWSGIGVAATLVGAVAGAAAVTMVAPVDLGAGSTSFGDVAGSDG